MAARLQASTSSAKPVLLRVDYDSGHGMGSTKTQRDEEIADEIDEIAIFILAVGRPGISDRASTSVTHGCRVSACRAARVRKLEANSDKKATKRELIVVATGSHECLEPLHFQLGWSFR